MARGRRSLSRVTGYVYRGLLQRLENYIEGEPDEGKARILTDADVEKTWTNVEQTGAKYGTAL